MNAFIRSTSVISPQKTFGIQGFPSDVMDYPNTTFLKCIEPPYRDFLDPMVSRRMSRIVKMSVCCALNCLRNAGIGMPDAIITGTGLGCIEDTEKFLGSVYANKERLMNPTPFIQSTHNTVAGAIAMAVKCHGYNATFTHRGFSFESAVQDALMQVADNPVAQVLTGAFDEITPDSYIITQRLGLWKTSPVNSLSLIDSKSPGTLPGEGIAFFVLSGRHEKNDLARLISMRTIFKPLAGGLVEDEVTDFISDAGLSIQDIDLAILGINGDSMTDQYYRKPVQDILSRVPVSCYKHLCGEYDTASSFAFWLASVIIRMQQVPQCIRTDKKISKKINNILIYNHLRGVNHSLYLLSTC